MRPLLNSFCFLLPLVVFSQVRIEGVHYQEFKPGVYTTQSTNPVWIGQELPIVDPGEYRFTHEHSFFLKVDGKPLALFDRIADHGETPPVGMLLESAIVEVDTVFYRERYRDFSQEWSVSFNVWYAIRLNGKKYYTDHKVHDIFAFQKEIPSFEQEFILVAQNTGYDGMYDQAYPGNFYFFILNNSGDKIFESEILNYDFMEEFWDADQAIAVPNRMTEEGFQFKLIASDSTLVGTWNGARFSQRMEPGLSDATLETWNENARHRPAVEFDSFLIRAHALGPIQVGQRISDLEEELATFDKTIREAWEYEFDGGGPAFLYSKGNSPLFCVIPELGSDSIIAIIALHPDLKTAEGIHPGMTVATLMEHYPDALFYENLMTESEFMEDARNAWTFVFLTDPTSQVASYPEIGVGAQPSNLQTRIDWIVIR